MDKLWSKTEISHLKRNADKHTLDELAQRFHTDPETVRQKMEELGLMPSAASASAVDAMVERFAQGVKALFSGDLAAAAELFEGVSTESEGRQLRDRALQYLQICRYRLADEVLTEDPYLAAIVAKNRGDFDEAAQLCAKHGDPTGDEKYAYLVASIKALKGEHGPALEHLSRAISLQPRNRVHAYHDPDFRAMRSEQGFSSLISSTRARA